MSPERTLTEAELHAFRGDLLAWYDAAGRALPWRATSDPYRIWLSEVMLQQTRVDQAAPYYKRFVERFPTVEALSDAPLDDVLLCWEGLGYYSRARNLHRAARLVVDEFGGRVPDEEEAIRSLPGVGPYTAAAVLSIAYERPCAVLDGNVARVLTRVFRVDADVKRSPVRRMLREIAGRLMDVRRPGAFNQALMELGATICTPHAPGCSSCPVRPVCAAADHGDQASYPVSAKRGPIPHFDVAVALLRDSRGRLLIQRRHVHAMLGGLWEFPGGKREKDESMEEACVRELDEELGVQVSIEGPFHQLSHAYSHFRITMHAFCARIVAGVPRSASGMPLKWVDPPNLDNYAFPRANRKLIERLAETPAPSTPGNVDT